MQFELCLTRIGHSRHLTWNYQYPLSAAIYKIISTSDQAYAKFLHDTGYGSGYKHFKFFTFSDIQTDFLNEGGRMKLQSDEARLRLAFHIPKAAEAFVRGILMPRVIELADSKSKVCFQVSQVIGIPTISSITSNGEVEVMLRLLSPVVAGRKNPDGSYTFLDPLNDEFLNTLLYNWKSKYTSIFGEEKSQQTFRSARLKLLLNRHAPVSRLITIKEGRPAETKIRGFKNFGLTCYAPGTAIELLLNGGIGLYNAQGMGCVEVNDEVSVVGQRQV